MDLALVAAVVTVALDVAMLGPALRSVGTPGRIRTGERALRAVAAPITRERAMGAISIAISVHGYRLSDNEFVKSGAHHAATLLRKIIVVRACITILRRKSRCLIQHSSEVSIGAKKFQHVYGCIYWLRPG